MYQVKLLQLIGIHEQNNHYHLHIKLHGNIQVTRYWQVDWETALHLQSITDFSKGYFYRLSWKSSQHKSSITQTYREESTQLEFSCSEMYTEQLLQIKNAETMEQLDKLSFLTRNLLVGQEKASTRSTKRPKRGKLPWPLTAAFISIFAILTTFTGHSIYTSVQAKPDKQADLVIEQVPPPERLEAKPETMLLKDNIAFQEEQTIPFTVLEEDVSSELEEGKVALTFDDGPSPFSNQIVDILKEFGAGGTFFLITSNISKYPGSVEYIHENAFSIGSHSVNHINFANSSVAKLRGELQQSIDAIEAVTGEEVTLFRPPYGQMNNSTKQVSLELGQRIVLWNNDPKDWEMLNANKIIQQIKATDVSGSIIILHETEATVEALPEIISYLLEQGLQLVSLQ